MAQSISGAPLGMLPGSRTLVANRDLGPDYFDPQNPEGLCRRLTKRLEGLGFKLTLEPLAQVA